MAVETDMSGMEVCLYATRRRYLYKIAAARDKPGYTAEFDQCIQQIEKINIILTRLAKRNVIRHWSTEFDLHSSI